MASDNKVETSYLEDLKRRGILDKLYQLGIINAKGYIMLEVRHKVADLMRQGLSRGQAVNHTAKAMRYTTRNIYYYL